MTVIPFLPWSKSPLRDDRETMLDRFNAALNEFDPFIMDGDIAAADEVLEKIIDHLCERPALTDEQRASIARLLTKAQLCASYANLSQDCKSNQITGE